MITIIIIIMIMITKSRKISLFHYRTVEDFSALFKVRNTNVNENWRNMIIIFFCVCSEKTFSANVIQNKT
jgi:hypothetical protein